MKSHARVVVIGGGVVGSNAALIALGMLADVVLFDTSIDRLRHLEGIFGGRVRLLASSGSAVEEAVLGADMVIGAVLLPGAKAPRLVDRAMLARMKPGAVLVDVSIDQGGCFETSRPTTHEDPTYVVDQVVHYCVANMPGAVPTTATQALTNVTLPYVRTLGRQGLDEVIRDHPDLRAGINVLGRKVVHPTVAASLGMAYAPLP
jgi:alanine dehydrogenase